MLDLIRVFIRVADLGSFSKAAKVLNVAPSSVTRCIDKLENQLNIRLFKRSTRALILTPDGSQFYQGAAEVLLQADALFDSVRGANAEPSGTLSISAFESFGRQCISPLLPEYLARYPKVNIQIELDNQMVDLNSENVDIGIRIGLPLDSNLHSRFLLKNEAVLCASPEYLSAHGMPNKPEDLTEHNCLLLNQDRQRCYWHFRNKNDHKKIAVKGNLTSTGGSPLLEAAVKGGGIILLSRWMHEEYLKRGTLVQCLPDWQASLYAQSSGDIYAVYQSNQHLKPSVRTFIDFMVDKIQYP